MIRLQFPRAIFAGLQHPAEKLDKLALTLPACSHERDNLHFVSLDAQPDPYMSPRLLSLLDYHRLASVSNTRSRQSSSAPSVR
jgi:hypothetical protein